MVSLAQAAATEPFAPWIAVSSFGALVLAGLLLVAGVGMVRRRPWCVKASVTWAVLKIVYCIPATGLAFTVSAARVDAMQQAATATDTSPGDGFFVVAHGFDVGVLGCGLLWTLLFPAFMLIWFLRAKVRTEVATWAGQDDLEVIDEP